MLSQLSPASIGTPPPQRRKRRTAELISVSIPIPSAEASAAANQALLDKLHAHEARLRRAGLAFEAFDHKLLGSTSSHNRGRDHDDDRNDHRDSRYDNPHNDAAHDLSRTDRPLAQAKDDILAHGGRSAEDGLTSRFISGASTTAGPSTAGPSTNSVGRSGAAGSGQAQTGLFPRQRGVLISEFGGKRYYEHALIGLLGQQYKQGPPLGWSHQPVHSDTVLPSLVAGLAPAPPQDRPKFQHPPAASVLQYWTIFKDNVHPLTMVIHAPTVEQMMIAGSQGGTSSLWPSSATAATATVAGVEPSADSSKQELLLPRSSDALKFAIYACAVASLKDSECQQIFGESQASLLSVMQSATGYALMDCSFLRLPDLDLLRAFVLLLTSLLHTTNSPSLWVMLGTAIRLAQSHGLHRDGTTLGLSPFETAMRRRLWWYIVSLDARVTEIMGSETCLLRSANTRLPSNVNDAVLHPGMPTLPVDGPGASDMMFCLIEYEIVRFLQRRDPRINQHGADEVLRDASPKADGTGPSGPGSSTPRRPLTVPDLEDYLEDKFLRFCDPVLPLHLLTTATARSHVCKLRQMAHRGRAQVQTRNGNSSGNGGTNEIGDYAAAAFDPLAEQANNKRILAAAARTVSYDNLIHSSPSLAGFLWHVHYWFPWGSPIFILKILASLRTPDEWDDDVQAAWHQIEKLHTHHPEFSAFDVDKPECLVIGDLTLKAWTVREAVFNATVGQSASSGGKGNDSSGGRGTGVGSGGARTGEERSQSVPPLIANLQARHRIGGALYPRHANQQHHHTQQQQHQHAMPDMGVASAVGGNLDDMVASFSSAASFAAAATVAAATYRPGLGGAAGPRLVESPFMGIDWSGWDVTRMY
ncbi:hypothetical protein SEUCBS140593_007033 [Sporothrix eucalyptigena]|uniref:Xylanolytic transcriptional activator regulatory domain-containing protein n=1 Tax=Sporothrix eucalyptigena TaxID=1812306 RepID=A0ABP0C9U2_9PEZI